MHNRQHIIVTQIERIALCESRNFSFKKVSPRYRFPTPRGELAKASITSTRAFGQSCARTLSSSSREYLKTWHKKNLQVAGIKWTRKAKGAERRMCERRYPEEAWEKSEKREKNSEKAKRACIHIYMYIPRYELTFEIIVFRLDTTGFTSHSVALKPELAPISRKWRFTPGPTRKRQGLTPPPSQVPAKLVGVIC